jgi:hypothetical protein
MDITPSNYLRAATHVPSMLFAFKYKVVNMVKPRIASSVPAAIAKRRTNNKHMQRGQTGTSIIQIGYTH